MNSIPFLDLKKQYQQIRSEVLKITEEIFENTAFSGGPYVEKFEKEFADYIGTSHSMGVNNGTSALHLALKALNIKEGDEVIIPGNTFIATAWAVSYVNATPVFIDCLPDTWNIDPAQVRSHITKKTKAIIGVHLYGQPFDVDSVKKIADEFGIPLIEDCAQAHGAKYKGIIVGKFGEMGCFSFYPGKNLGAYGEAGGVVTDKKEFYDRIQLLKNHGSRVRYYHEEIGYNMRMEGVQAGILSVKLKYIDGWNERRKQIAKRYFSEIRSSKIKFQHQPDWSDSVYHLLVVTTDKREDFIDYLKNNNISAGLHYPVPCHLQKAYEYLGYKKGQLPNSEYLAEHCVSLPMYAELTEEEVNKIIEVVNKY